MNDFPKRIKKIEKEYLLKLRKFRNLFILFWLFNLVCVAYLVNLSKKENISESLSSIAVLLMFGSLVVVILALIFLYKTVNILYINKYKYGAIVGFILSWIVPFGGLISFIIFIQVLLDSRKVFKILSIK